jgi:probable rRNA maturation factor
VDELLLLAVHGTLHICGWDHAEPVEEAGMRAMERHVLAGLGHGEGRDGTHTV